MAINENDLVSGPESNISASTNTALQTAPSTFKLQFSKELQEFYKSHNFDLSGSSISSPYRYVRLNPRYDEEHTLNMLRNEVTYLRDNKTCEHTEGSESNKNNAFPKAAAVLNVPWLEKRWAFYALPAEFPLSKSPCFRSGKIYGMDVSSGAGVAVLLTDYYDNANTFFPDYNSERVQSAIKKKTNASIGDNFDATGELRILDLCCSPGLKLLQMADFFHEKSSTKCITDTRKQKSVKIVGVDICKHRMNVCKCILQKYFIDSGTSGRVGRSKESPGNVIVQLYLEDGTTFGVNQPPKLASSNAFSSNSSNLIFDSRVATEEMVQRGGKRKRMNKSARAREKKKLRQIASFESDSVTKEAQDIQNGSEVIHGVEARSSIGLFDYALVDAECSTDGSFKHIMERISSIKLKKDVCHREKNERLTDPIKLAELVDLQRKLIASGFRLLKCGGTLVYSTCSLSEDQNEKVVKWLLESNQDAVLIPIHFSSLQSTEFVTEGSLVGTVRFYPNLVIGTKSTTLLLGDGFFVAKIRKRPK